MGAVVIAPLSDKERDSEPTDTRFSVSTDKHMVIPFQNEYLFAALCDEDATEASQDVVCTVPDLISILGQDGEAIGSQDLRYGLRVHVIGLPAHRLWKTDRALKIGGPEGFGIQMPVTSIEAEFVESRSVIDEFNM